MILFNPLVYEGGQVYILLFSCYKSSVHIVKDLCNMKRFILTKTPHIPHRCFFFSKTEIQGEICMTSYDHLHVYTMAQKQLHRANAQTFHWYRKGNAMKNTKKSQPQPHIVNGPSVDTAFASSVLISQDVKLAKQSRVVHFFMTGQEYHKTDESQLKLSILLFRRLK